MEVLIPALSVYPPRQHPPENFCHITALLRRLPGGSQPVLMRSSEGETYIVKLQNNPQGSRILCNELISYRIARLLGLSVPQCRLALIDGELADQLYFETPAGRRQAMAGLHFASKIVVGSLQGRVYEIFPQRWNPLLRNAEMRFGFELLNLWLKNADRPQYLYWRLCRSKKFTITAIDYGHCLGGPEWRMEAGLPPDALWRKSSEGFTPWLRRLRQIPSSAIEESFAEIPEEWGLDGVQRRRLLDVVLERRLELLRRMESQACQIGAPMERHGERLILV